MISSREIKEKAREFGVPESTIERDYAQNWLLKYLSSLNMALKGGTGIKKLYISNYRFSDDLDFTLLEQMDENTLSALVKKAVTQAREESGINFRDEVESIKTESGFRNTVYFHLLQRAAGTPISIRVDFTSPDYEQILLEIEQRRIFHPYSDGCNFLVKAYSLEEIMAEKIRSLFERTRPRDLYDVWFLDPKIERSRVLVILPKKFEIRGVKFDLSSLEERKNDFANAWEKSLGHQIKELPDFDRVYEVVVEQLKLLGQWFSQSHTPK